MLNVDTALEPGCVGRLLDALEADGSLGGVQPRILQLEDAFAAPGQSLRPASTVPGRRSKRMVGLSSGAWGKFNDRSCSSRREVFGVCGAACLLRRELFSELGGYDEHYFAFYEDVDLNVRARIAGWHFEYVPEAVVWHVGNTSWSEGFPRPAADNARLVARNRLSTQVKFMSVNAILRIAAVEVGSLLRAAARHRFLATLRGKLEALYWLPRLLGDRRYLCRTGNPSLAQRWLGR